MRIVVQVVQVEGNTLESDLVGWAILLSIVNGPCLHFLGSELVLEQM